MISDHGGFVFGYILSVTIVVCLRLYIISDHRGFVFGYILLVTMVVLSSLYIISGHGGFVFGYEFGVINTCLGQQGSIIDDCVHIHTGYLTGMTRTKLSKLVNILVYFSQ
jgi:hypothetical protein